MLDYHQILALEREMLNRKAAYERERDRQDSELRALALAGQMASMMMAEHFFNSIALAMNPNVSEAFLRDYIARAPI